MCRLTSTSTHNQHEPCCSCKSCLWSKYLSVCSHKHSGDTQSPVLVGCVGSVCQWVCWWQAGGWRCSVWLQLPGLHCLAFSMSKSSLPLANSYSHKHRHACWLHPARTLLLIGARSAIFFLFIIFFPPSQEEDFFWQEGAGMALDRQHDPGFRWQLCYDFSARSWLMVWSPSLSFRSLSLA